MSSPPPWRTLILPEVPWLMPSAFMRRHAPMMACRFLVSSRVIALWTGFFERARNTGRCERRNGDDEAVDQDWNTEKGCGDDRAGDRRDLEPADGAEDFFGGCAGEAVASERRVDEVGLAVAAGSIKTRAEAGNLVGAD